MDVDRKKGLKRQAHANEQSKFLETLPLPVDRIISLIEFVGGELCSRDPKLTSACDHSLRFSKIWCLQNGTDEAKIVDWLRENGGFCDCEVIFNVDGRLEEALDWQGKQ